MDLLSRTLVIEKLENLINEYRSDTEPGRFLREGLSVAIDAIRRKEHFTLEHIGHGELEHFMQLAKKRMELLSQEKTIDVFAITGLYKMRYTLDKDKAKAIFLEEIDYINEDDGVDDFLGESLKIDLKKVRESDLTAYTLE